MKLARFLTCGFTLALYLYLWSIVYNWLADFPATYFLKPVLVSSGVSTLMVIILLYLLVGVIELSLCKNRKLSLWETIFWPLISADVLAQRIKKWKNSFDVGVVAEINNRAFNRIGGECTKIHYMDPYNYCQTVTKEGEMTVTVGPAVNVVIYGNQHSVKVAKPLIVATE